MSDRMSDERFEETADCLSSLLSAKSMANEARRARAAEKRLQEEADAAAKSFLTAQGQRDAERAEARRLRLDVETERARAERAESELAGLRESGEALAAAIAQADAALDEFASHHPREDGRHLPFPECVREAMDTLRGRIASLEAERAKQRAALSAPTCPAVCGSAHGLLVCTRELGRLPPCTWKRKRPEERCQVCSGACEWDKETTG